MTNETEYNGKEAVEFAKNFLKETRSNPIAWTVEYEDPLTEEVWVMDYPQSELQGGGPPRLRKK